jgi:cytochrome P450
VLPFLDHTTDAFAADPHGQLRAMREESWIVRTPNGLGVLSYAACNALLLDPAFRPGIFEMMRRATPGAGREGGAGEGPRTLLGSEGRDHQDLRRVVMPWFTPRRIDTLREYTANLAGELLDTVSSVGGCEFMADVATRIPPTIFCLMVGCDLERGPDLAHWSAVALQAFSGDPEVMGNVRVALRYLRHFADDLLESKRSAPGDDITSALVRGIDDGVLTHGDARSLLTELLSASVDNTTHSMGLVLWLLCTHPDQWQRVANDRSHVERAVEECGRFEPVIRHGKHFNERDAELLGFRIPAGTLMTAYLDAAHRDPDVFEDPDRFDVTRRLPQPQLVYGIGRHYCIGAALARMQIQEVLRAVTSRWVEPRLGSDVRVKTAVGSCEAAHLPIEFRPIEFRSVEFSGD